MEVDEGGVVPSDDIDGQIVFVLRQTHRAFVRGPAFRELPCNDHCGLGGPLDSEILWNVC